MPLLTIFLTVQSVDQWRDEVAGIVNRQVKHFKLTPIQKQELKAEV